jgi:ketosteroid isomerase-like protein
MKDVIHQTEADLASVRETISSFLAAIHQGDVEAVLGFYAPNGIVMPPMGEVVTGTTALRAYWQDILSGLPLTGLSYRPIALDMLGPDHVSELTEFVGQSGDAPQKGRYCQIWQRSGDGWQLRHDTYNMVLAA